MSAPTLADLNATMEEALAAQAVAASELQTLRDQLDEAQMLEGLAEAAHALLLKDCKRFKAETDENLQTLAAGLLAQDAWIAAAIEVNRRDRSDAPDDACVRARAALEISHYKMLRVNLLPAALLEMAREVNAPCGVPEDVVEEVDRERAKIASDFLREWYE